MNWQPIETAPKDGTAILLAQKVAEGFGPGVAAGSWQTHAKVWWGVCGSGLVLHLPTHWQPLPEPPQ